ncbi:hypothetical protein E2542_SST04792 [Spatholobus suberectus]|nr:hypothetical protein E2542_SST04792 [Spatholobus suberectus]
MENHIYASSYSPSTNYRFLDPDASAATATMFLSHHRADAALRFPSATVDADIAPPGVASRIASSAAANLLSPWPPAAPSSLDLKRSSDGMKMRNRMRMRCTS